MSNNNNRPQQQPYQPYQGYPYAPGRSGYPYGQAPQNYQPYPHHQHMRYGQAQPSHQQTPPQLQPHQYQQYNNQQQQSQPSHQPHRQQQGQWGYYPYYMNMPHNQYHPNQMSHYPPPQQSQQPQPVQTQPVQTKLKRSQQASLTPQKLRITPQKQRERSFTPKQTPSKYSQQENIEYESMSEQSSDYQSEEEIYFKRKVIAKKKDPVLDSREEIRKWIEARKRNYPRRVEEKESQEGQEVKEGRKREKTKQQEMSILQKKIRQKLVMITGDARSVIKKQKDLDILRRFILYPRRVRKPYQGQKYERNRADQGRPLVEEILPEGQMINKVEDEVIEKKVEVIKQIIVQKDQEQEQENQDAQEIPLQDGNAKQLIKQRQAREECQRKADQRNRGHRQQLSVDVIIKHLQMKQQQDVKTLQNLMDYKSNSSQYRYQFQTLQTNLLLDNVFRDTSYMLQVIRHVVKNNFFQ